MFIRGISLSGGHVICATLLAIVINESKEADDLWNDTGNCNFKQQSWTRAAIEALQPHSDSPVPLQGNRLQQVQEFGSKTLWFSHKSTNFG